MRSSLIVCLSLSLPYFACQNFNECTTDSDCGTLEDASGSALYCTQDHLCARGTPAAKLCTEIYPANSPQNAVVVGALVNAAPGDDLLPLLSFKLGIDQINKERNSEPPLALHICEISATPDDPLKAMEILARQRNAVAVVGPSFSGNVASIEDEVVRSGIPIMSHSATSPVISSFGTAQGPKDGLFYRVVPADTLQAPVMARQIPPGAASLDILSVDDPYGSGFKSNFVNAYSGKSGKMPNLQLAYAVPKSSTDVTETTLQAAKIVNDSPAPDVVVAITNVYSENVIRALVHLPKTTQVFMADGAKNQTVLDLINTSSMSGPFNFSQQQMADHLKRISGTAPIVDTANLTGTSAYSIFNGDFKDKWHMDPDASIYAAYAYDAIYAVGIAIGAAGAEVTAAQISVMLSRINRFDNSTQKCLPNSSNSLVVGPAHYREARNLVAAGNGLVLLGTTGTICFNPHGDRVDGLYERWSIDVTNQKFISMTPL